MGCREGERIMCKLLRILLLGSLALIVTVVPAKADFTENPAFKLEAGYRLDELDWNIAGGIDGPNIISELEWEDLEIYQIRGGGKLGFGNGKAPFTISVRGSVAYGWIVDGENQDSDFDGDDRTIEFSRSNNKSDDGDVFDVSAGIGPRFRMWTDRLAITPVAGYSYHEQNLTLTDGFQTVSRPDIDPHVPPTGPFGGLDSTYETRWYGPWAGIDIEWEPAKRFRLYGSFEYHWADFEAEADWNLRDDFAHPKSFEHEADDGDAIILALGGMYDLTDHWSVHLNLNYQEWKAEDGEIRFFYTDGREVIQRLNEVNWESWAANVGVSYRFL